MNPRRRPCALCIDHSAIAACWTSKIVRDLGAGFRSNCLTATCAQVVIRSVSDVCPGHWNTVSTTASAVAGASPSGTSAGAQVGRCPKAAYPPN